MLGGATIVRVVVQESKMIVNAAAMPHAPNSVLRRRATLRETLESHRTFGVMPKRSDHYNEFLFAGH
jgi:hypothetical protein